MMILQKMNKNNLICVGTIGKPRGLRGEFFLNSYCEPAENIINYIKVIKIIDHDHIKFKYIKKSNSKFHAKLENINEINKIKDFTNLNLYIQSEDLPEIASEEIYWHDLKGMSVIDINNNENLGIVKGLNNFGSNDCLIVKPSAKSIDNQERLIPFIRETFVLTIDKKLNILKVDWQSDY